jgi:carbonic anhydrase
MISPESLHEQFRAASGTVDDATPSGPRFVVLACMDRGVQPEHDLGLPAGSARIVQNAGGRASDDALRSLVLAWSELGAEEFVVLHHTRCTLVTHTNEALQRAASAASGADASGQDFLVVTDLEGSVTDDVERIRDHELIPADIAVVGLVHDVDHGSLQLVVGDARSQLPFARGSPGASPPLRLGSE